MGDKKELPKFIFKFPIIDEELEEKTKQNIKNAFGENCLIIFADEDFQMFQLTKTYEKII